MGPVMFRADLPMEGTLVVDPIQLSSSPEGKFFFNDPTTKRGGVAAGP